MWLVLCNKSADNMKVKIDMGDARMNIRKKHNASGTDIVTWNNDSDMKLYDKGS